MSFVLICADNSDHSKYAMEYYLKFIHREGKAVKVVHCPENWRDVGVMEGPTPATLMKLQAEADANTKACKENSEELLTKYHVPGEFVKLVGKEPWELIIKMAKEGSASMIVIGTRGQSKLKRTIMGSCSSSVVHHAHCPVLVCCHPKHHGKHDH